MFNRIGCYTILLFLFIQNIWAQCSFNASIQIPDTVCGGINIVNNSSLNMSSYQWDFCLGDIENSPTKATIATISGYQVSNINCYFDTLNNKWVGLINSSNTGGGVAHLDLNSDISAPIQTNMLTSSNIIGTSKIDVIYYKGAYHGYVIGKATKSLYYFNFGSTLNPVTPVSLGNIAALSAPGDLSLKIHNDSLYILFTNTTTLSTGVSVYRFNTPSTLPVLRANWNVGLQNRIIYYEDCDDSNFFTCPVTGNYILKYNLGSNFPYSTSFDTIQTPNQPKSFQIIREANKRYLFYSYLTKWDRIDLSPSWLSTNIVQNVITFTNNSGFCLVKNQGKWIGLSLEASARTVQKVTFPQTCTGSASFSNQFTPSSLTGFSNGNLFIEYKMVTPNGLTKYILDSVFVRPSPMIDFSFNNACYGQATNFTSNISISGDVIQSVLWDFGNGQTFSGMNAPPVTYPSSGSYPVKVIAMGALGCIDSLTKSVIIPILPSASFNYNIGCQGSITSFSNTSMIDPSDSIVNYTWNLGGQISSLANPSIIFNNSGLTTINLQITTKYGCMDDTTFVIDVPAKPIASFTFQNSCLSQPTQFINASSGLGNTYVWDFGDGNSSTLSNPTNTYNSLGNFNVKLVVTSSNGCKDSLNSIITIANPVPPTFTVSSPICQSAPITFTNTSGPAQYLWDFGTGNSADTSNQTSPIFSFSNPGNYFVKLKTISGSDCISIDSVLVQVNPGPVANFIADSICEGNVFVFRDETFVPIGQDVLYAIWNYGDGIIDTINLPVYPYNLNHQYSTTGNFTVSLTAVSNSGCVNTYTKNARIYSKPIASATISNAVTSSTWSIVENSIADTSIQSWTWNVTGLGSFIGQNPSIVSSTPGNFNVELIIETVTGCRDTFLTSVQVNGPSFYIPDTSCSLVDVQNISVGPFTNYQWDFCIGDLDNIPVINNVNQTSHFPSNFTVYFDTLNNKWVGFVNHSNTTGNVVLADFGSDITSIPTYSNLLTSPNIIGSSSLQVIKINGNYHGYIIGKSSKQLYYFNFGPNLNPVTPVSLGSIAALNSPSDIALFLHNDSLYISIANGAGTSNGLMFYRFNSLSSLPVFQSAINYSNLDRLFFYQDGDSRFLLSSPAVGNFILKTTGFPSSPQTDTIFVNNKPKSIFACREGNKRYIFYGQPLGLDKITLNSAWQMIQNLTLNSVIANSNGCFLSKTNSKWYAFSYNSSNKRLHRFDFPDTCLSIPLTSTLQNPTQIEYQTYGLQHIELIASDSIGLPFYAEDSIYVLPKPNVEFSYSGACFNNPVTYVPNISINQDVIQSVLWDFGNSTTSTSLNPSPILYSPGTYQVKLLVSGSLGCQDSFIQTVLIPIQLQANFNSNISCQSNPTLFSQNCIVDPGDTIVSYFWTFGSEGTSSLANPSFTFANSGNVDVKLVIQTKNGCQDSITQTLNIPEKPIANWSFNQTCLGSTTIFNDLSTNAIQYEWDFGDGNSNINANTTHIFATTGTYIVKLKVTSANGCTDSLSQTVVITNIPTVSFSVPSQICQGKYFTLTDLSTVTGSQINSWFWDFGTGNPADTSNIQHPTFTYNQSGNYWVKLKVQAGSSCFVTDSVLVSVTPAATPGFISTVACLGQVSTFQDTTFVPSGLSVLQAIWIYGDGSTDTLNNPSYPYAQNHLYANTGTYPVQLKTLSSTGCEGIFNGFTTIYQYPTANAIIPNGIAGEQIQLLDASSSADTSIQSWSWNITGIGTFTDQNPVFTTIPGTFPVELIISTFAGCQDTFNTNLSVSGAYFTVQDTICMQNDLLSVSNQSTPMSSQYWDMCMGDLDLQNIKTNLGNPSNSLATPSSYTTFFDTTSGNWYGFVAHSNSTGGRVIRVNFGPDFNNFTGDTLINNSNTVGTSKLDVIHYQGNYHGYLVGRSSRQLFYFDFGNSLANTPTVTSLGTLSASIQNPSDIKVVNRNDSLYILIANAGTNGVAIFRFNSPSTMPVLIHSWSNIGSINRINYFKDSYGPLVFTIPATGNMILKHSFTNNFPYSPKTDTIVVNSSPRGIFATREGNRKYLFWTNATSLNRMKMDLNWNMIQTDSIQSFTNAVGCWLVKDSSDWHAFVLETTARTIQKIDFENPCSSTPLMSTNLNPGAINYSSAGMNYLELKSYDASGNIYFHEDSIYVVPSVVVDFNNSGNCEGNISFTNLSTFFDTSAVISYSWNFGDGSALDFSTNPSHIYSAGNYVVTLTATIANGCSTSKTMNLTVNPLPQANFSFISSCANNPTLFTNLSVIANPGTINFYKWDFGDGSVSYDVNPSYQYLVGGNYMISLVAISDLGCADTLVQNITIPKINFTFENTCFGEAVSFTPDVIYTSDVVTGYSWDFGDGSFDNNPNPLHVFTQLRNYTVKLTVNTAGGCSDTLVKVVEITQRPNALFSTSGNFCVGNPVAFLDASTITTRPIDSWRWNFNDPAAGVDSVSNAQNPIHTFTTAGNYQVTLEITTTTGCKATYQQMFTVGIAPIANFGIPDTNCTLKPIQLTDSSTTSSGNLTWFWNLPNGSYSTLQNPSINFAQAGIYPISLTVTSDLGCIDTKLDTFVVFQAPTADFNAIIPQNSPAIISFQNISVVADSFAWFVNGNFESNAIDFTYNFQNSGDYTVTLISYTQNGCNVIKTIQFNLQAPLIPVWDIAVEQVRYINNNNRLKVFADVRNKGNYQVNKFEMYLKLGFDQQNYEVHFDTLAPGQIMTIPLTAEVFVNPYESEPFICVKADKPNDSTDVYLADNEQCTAIVSDFVLLPITPNPVQTQFTLEYIIPSSDLVRIWIVDLNGKKLTTIYEGISPAGLNRVVYDASALAKSEYLVRVEFQSKFRVRKFMKW